MPEFQYIAMDGNGKEQKGTMEGSSDQDVIVRLKKDGLFPTNVSEVKGGKSAGKKKGGAAKAKAKKKGGGAITLGTPKIPSSELCTFTRQMATLLDAGLPLVRALRTLERQAMNPVVGAILGEIADDVEGGTSFSEALVRHKKSFSDLYVNMVRAGEASGAMEMVLNRLAEFMEKAERLYRKVKGALTYPVVVLSIAMLITYGLMVFIVPKFQQIFSDMLGDEPLPGLTLAIMKFSQLLTNQWYLIPLPPIFIVVVFKLINGTPKGRFLIDNMLLRMPPFGGLVTKTSVSRFARTLGTLLSSGVTILQALEIVRDTSSNAVVANAVQNIHDNVKEGENMTDPMRDSNVFPQMVISMVEVGEETGALPDMLVRVADIYEDEVDTAVEGLTALIEPLMIVSLAVIVGTIVIAMFLPLIKIIEKLG